MSRNPHALHECSATLCESAEDIEPLEDIVVPTCCGLCVVIPASELARGCETGAPHGARVELGAGRAGEQVGVITFVARLFSEMMGGGRLRESS